MGEPKNKGKQGWEPPTLPGESLPCPESKQEPSWGTGTAPGAQAQLQGWQRDVQSQ